MEFAVLWLFFAILVAVYASRRGRSGLGWFLLAVVLSPLLAFLLCLAVGPIKTEAAASMAPTAATHVKCPACAEFVLPEARVCKHCGAQLTPQAAPMAPPREAGATNLKEVWQRNKAIIIVLAIIGFMAVASWTR